MTKFKINVSVLAIINLIALAGLMVFQYYIAANLATVEKMPTEAFWLAIGVNLGALATALSNTAGDSGPPAWVGIVEKAIDKLD